MNIYLLGYMGSGKSTVGRQLAANIGYDFIDLDAYICKEEKATIPKIFETKGEIYFRKTEARYLKTLVSEAQGKLVVALGGGTPCYGNAMELLKNSGHQTIYLNLPFQALAERLWTERASRPLIASIDTYDDLEDYVRKHLFERGYYYNQAQIVLKINPTATAAQVVEEIVARLF
ncbi:MAG: shikimate kinase [Flavobacteriales bacterium]|jgi:shikimate kinase